MNPSRPRRSPCPSFYDYVGTKISELIPRLGLEQARAQIMLAYSIICSESLAYSARQRAPGFSRINHDGTPFQFAATLGTPVPALRFLSEAVATVSSGAERIRLSRDCIARVAQTLHTDAGLSMVSDLLHEVAPATDPELLADHAGAFWIGVGFAAGQDPQLTVYINAKWGNDRDAWKRLRRFASYFGHDKRWSELEAQLATEMQPLGMAVTLSGSNALEGRIYVSAYGNTMARYEELAHSVASDAFTRELRRYVEFILREDRIYPTPTAVCSFGFGRERSLDFKFELCGHCIFSNDVEAAARLCAWLDSVKVDQTAYVEVLNVLSEGCLSDAAPLLHCYVGLGLKQEKIYSTVYLKPCFVESADAR